MPPVTKSLGEGTQSVLLTVAILKEIAESGGTVGISEVANKVGTSKSRVHRHVQTLVACDFLARSAKGDTYTAGLSLIALGHVLHERHDILATARPIMHRLNEALGHTAIISQVVPEGLRVLQSVSRGQPIVLEIRAGTVLPFETSAQGLVAMAYHEGPRAGSGRALDKAMRAHGSRLEGELAEIRRQGWGRAQMRAGLLGIAAPILDGSGRLVATLALLNTAVEMERTIEEGAPSLLIEAANEIARLTVSPD